ncbi:hypothetical protein D915_007279 [Fasciola hepatica]|uniref:Uncharacterized protein n=1 Tax=Fasciola hepatica TaxID=6192 RepID=A0A4E0R6S1_FASHE|nr:hypothetical protein D915_007279 [Fasciola hepatica]
MANGSDLTNGGFGSLDDCSLPLAVNNAPRCPPNVVYISTDFQLNSQQQQSSRLMYRGNLGFSGGDGPYSGVDQQTSPCIPPPTQQFRTQPRSQLPNPTAMLQPGTPSSTAVHQFQAAASAADLHPATAQNTGGCTGGPAGGTVSAVSTSGHIAHLPPGARMPFPGAMYQELLPACLHVFCSKFGMGSGHSFVPRSQRCCHDYNNVPTADQFVSYRRFGTLVETTPTSTSTNSAAGHQALQQRQQ